MKRMLTVLVAAGVAVGGGAAAWAGPLGGGPNREAAKACAAKAKETDPDADRAALKEAVKACLKAQGITRPAPTPEQQARRDALRTCLQEAKAKTPDGDRAAVRAAALPCLEKAGIAPGQIKEKLAAAKECRDKLRAEKPDADRATLRPLIKECVETG